MNRTRAFTLAELLIVLAILCILVAIILPVYSVVRAKGNATTCLSNEHQMGIALRMYADDYEGKFPPQESIDSRSWLTIEPLHCPLVDTEDSRGINGYAINRQILPDGSGQNDATLLSVADPAATALLTEQMGGISSTGAGHAEDNYRCEGCGPPNYQPGYTRHFGGSHVTFIDGHTKWLSGADIGKLRFDWAERKPY